MNLGRLVQKDWCMKVSRSKLVSYINFYTLTKRRKKSETLSEEKKKELDKSHKEKETKGEKGCLV